MKPLIYLLTTTAAWAQAPYLPALYDVSGVATGDVLNLRAGAGVDHPVIGQYARDQRRISVLQLSDDSNCWLVALGENRAWVSMHNLILQPALGPRIQQFGQYSFLGDLPD